VNYGVLAEIVRRLSGTTVATDAFVYGTIEF